MSHSKDQSANATHVLEQRNLLGGTDLVPVMGGGKRKRARQFHVASEKKVGFAAALALVVEHGRERAKETGVTSLSKCPKCDHVGPTAQDFGYRIIRGERRPQSWCRGCRGQHLPPSQASAPKWSTSSGAPASQESLFPPETLRARPRDKSKGKSKGGKRNS